MAAVDSGGDVFITFIAAMMVSCFYLTFDINRRNTALVISLLAMDGNG